MDLRIRPLLERDLREADHVFRLAFGTFLGMPDPTKFGEDADHVRTRWLADPNAAFAAEVDGRIVGSNFVTRLGSFGFFGPLTVHPDFWDQGIAKRLLEPTMNLFTSWGVAHTALFTFANSPKHVGLYRSFGYWPRFLTLIMSKTVQTRVVSGKWSRFSDMSGRETEGVIEVCRGLTDSIYNGLDLTQEIMAVRNQNLGETVLLWDDGRLLGLAVCHCGPGTEAGGETCYIKFGMVRNDLKVDDSFGRLLDACENLAAEKGLTRVVAGVNTGCENACKRMNARGFRSDFQGVMMLRPSEPAFDTPDRYVICDLR